MNFKCRNPILNGTYALPNAREKCPPVKVKARKQEKIKLEKKNVPNSSSIKLIKYGFCKKSLSEK